MHKNNERISIYRYFHLNRKKDIFSNLTQLEFESDNEYLEFIKENNLAVKSYNENYLRCRFNTEKSLYDQFVKKGGNPQIKHPYYFTLGKCDEWFYCRKGAFGCVEFFLEEFDPSVISFTYGDSIPTFMPKFQDGKEYRSKIYTFNEIKQMIDKYGMPNEWNTFEQFGPENYIEVQIWSNEFDSMLTSRLTTFQDISINELSTRILLSNKNICLDLSTQKSLEYFIKKSMTHIRWPWFCELIKRVPSTVFCDDYVHGIPHAHKCALMAFIIANELDFNIGEFNTLVYAAFFHDIGRKCCYSKKNHGLISSEKVDSFILENDIVYIDQLKEALIKHEDCVLPSDENNLFLVLLRDIDSLDYLRLGIKNYTTKYLKSSIAKKLIKCITELNILMYLDDHQYIYKLVNEVKI